MPEAIDNLDEEDFLSESIEHEPDIYGSYEYPDLVNAYNDLAEYFDDGPGPNLSPLMTSSELQPEHTFHFGRVVAVFKDINEAMTVLTTHGLKDNVQVVQMNGEGQRPVINALRRRLIKKLKQGIK